MNNPSGDMKAALVQAALDHVVFDGWSPATFQMAVESTGIDPIVANGICPRGALDLAVQFHRDGDDAMAQVFADTDTSAMKIREKIAYAVELRLRAAADKDAVRRGTTLFALPQHAAEGAALIWGTADRIWQVLGDTSKDVNWYTKRATLSAVYGATVLFWLGDDSEDHTDTKAFLARRIENVMQFEKLKAGVAQNGFLSKLMAGPAALLGNVKAPTDQTTAGLPGRWRS